MTSVRGLKLFRAIPYNDKFSRRNIFLVLVHDSPCFLIFNIRPDGTNNSCSKRFVSFKYLLHLAKGVFYNCSKFLYLFVRTRGRLEIEIEYREQTLKGNRLVNILEFNARSEDTAICIGPRTYFRN